MRGSVGAPLLYLPAVAWDYRFQRPQQLARAVAAAGHPVLYVEGFLRTRLQPGRQLLAASPGVSRLRLRVPGRPDPYREILSAAAAARLADVVVAGLRERPCCVLVQLPFWAALGHALAAALGVPLVYDRIDLHTGFPGVPPHIADAERELAARADLVVATAQSLADDVAGHARRLVVVRNAVDLSGSSKRRPGPRPSPTAAAAAGAAPCIAYVGALGPWFHSAALRAAAERHPEWRIRLAGEVEDSEVAALGRLPNVELLGEIPFRDVPAFLSTADVALVPFRDLPLTRAVDPVKLYEALALGLPVVARRLPETAPLGRAAGLPLRHGRRLHRPGRARPGRAHPRARRRAPAGGGGRELGRAGAGAAGGGGGAAGPLISKADLNRNRSSTPRTPAALPARWPARRSGRAAVAPALEPRGADRRLDGKENAVGQHQRRLAHLLGGEDLVRILRDVGADAGPGGTGRCSSPAGWSSPPGSCSARCCRC